MVVAGRLTPHKQTMKMFVNLSGTQSAIRIVLTQTGLRK
jgi:hypothetical protein